MAYGMGVSVRSDEILSLSTWANSRSCWVQVKNNVRRAMPYHKISLQKQREANQKHDARGPGHN